VEFQVDLNGIVAIDAKEKKSGVSQSCTITGASQLSAAEVERLVQEAARNRQQDKLDASRLRLAEQVKLLLEFLKTNAKVRDDDRLGHQRSALQDAYETTNRDSRVYD
jgi:molecular chaperone DnaK (HSP70)